MSTNRDKIKYIHHVPKQGGGAAKLPSPTYFCISFIYVIKFDTILMYVQDVDLMLIVSQFKHDYCQSWQMWLDHLFDSLLKYYWLV